MSFPTFDIVHVPVRPVGKVLPSQQIDEALSMQAQLRRAAAHRLRRARAAIVSRRARLEADLGERCAVLEAECEARAEDAEARAVAAAVQWLVDESALEVRVASQVAQRVADCAADAFVAFAANEDRAALLALRVRESIGSAFAECQAALRLSPDDHASLTQLLSDSACRLLVDADLPAGKAVLESPYVRVVINLNRHAALLAAHLRSPLPQDSPGGAL